MLKIFVQASIASFNCLAVSGTLYADSFLVENLENSGSGTLREAIALANASPGMDTIDFDAGLNGMIVLGSALPQLNDDVIISGPGAEIITISGNSLHQPFFVSSESTVTITGLTIADGRSGIGGAIGNEGNLTITGCVLSNNHADTDGGAIDNFGGSLTVNQCTLTGNSTGEFGVGAGITNAGNGTVSIIESTFAGNTAGFSGGAMDNNGGTVSIVRSTFTANDADYGGALENGGTLSVRNSTFSGNAATTAGGGIDNFSNGEATVEFSTLTENSAGSGAGIENTATITLKNSLVVNSAAGDNCFNNNGAFTALGVNFATDASCTGFTETTTGGIKLGPLTENGGPTQTHALQTGSVAIDAALDCTLSNGSTAVTLDQRGQDRPVGLQCDSGAFENPGSLPAIIFLDGFESG